MQREGSSIKTPAGEATSDTADANSGGIYLQLQRGAEDLPFLELNGCLWWKFYGDLPTG